MPSITKKIVKPRRTQRDIPMTPITLKLFIKFVLNLFQLLKHWLKLLDF